MLVGFESNLNSYERRIPAIVFLTFACYCSRSCCPLTSGSLWNNLILIFPHNLKEVLISRTLLLDFEAVLTAWHCSVTLASISARPTRVGKSLESCLHMTLATRPAPLTGPSVNHDDVVQCKVLDVVRGC
jgi:hypothetical protein